MKNHAKEVFFSPEFKALYMVVALIGYFWIKSYLPTIPRLQAVLLLTVVAIGTATVLALIYDRYSIAGRERQERIARAQEIPLDLMQSSKTSIVLGEEADLACPIHLPDSIRARHVHILGATGSGKTESVLLNFIRQDIVRGLGAIILDAKGDTSFMRKLQQWIPPERIQVFDLAECTSKPYNAIQSGSPLESAQRLFSSLNWSEEFYASKARSVLQIIFQKHHKYHGCNPTIREISVYLDSPRSFAKFVASEKYPQKMAEEDYKNISGLKDQINSLCTAHLQEILSPNSTVQQIDLTKAQDGMVIYFRLQSLISPQIAATVGKLIINHINHTAGTAHRSDDGRAKMTPVYLDEFATFACPEFADLISKARSAGFALHFSHQSIGDLVEVSEGFLNRITDNSATKIVLRINDPDTADYFARSLGTKSVQKITRQLINAQDTDAGENSGVGSSREAHQFRASPDLLKTLPTGTAAVLIAHGHDMPEGAAAVFKIKFPLQK